MSINVAKWTFFLSLCASRIASFLQLTFFQLPGRSCLKLLPFLVHCCFCIRSFHRIKHRNKLVNQIVMGHRSKTCACHVIFMIFRQRRFQTLSRGLMRFHDTCVLCFGNRVGFTTLRFSFLKPGVLRCLFQSIAASNGTSNFLLAFLLILLYSPSSGLMKQMPLSLRALSSFGFLFPNSCFSLF